MARKRRRRRFKTQEVAQVHADLRERFRQAGRGSITAAEADLGLQAGYYRHYRLEQTLDLGLGLATLDYLEVDAGEFFAALFGGPSRPSPRPSPATGEGAPARTAAERLGAAVHRAQIPARPADRDESLRAELEAWLVQMDDLRYEDPEAALKELWSRAAEVPRCLAAGYLGVCGSCYRMIGNLSDARERLFLALAWADGDDEASCNDSRTWSPTTRSMPPSSWRSEPRACTFGPATGRGSDRRWWTRPSTSSTSRSRRKPRRPWTPPSDTWPRRPSGLGSLSSSISSPSQGSLETWTLAAITYRPPARSLQSVVRRNAAGESRRRVPRS
ncbi:MAG: hypothetical protein V3T72_01395 [Thermoanaerobaculia bacterium]